MTSGEPIHDRCRVPGAHLHNSIWGAEMRFRKTIVSGVILVAAGIVSAGSRTAEIPFQQHMIDPGAFETCAIGDINRDGRPDIVSGENWYEGPHWAKHPFRLIEYFSRI